MEKLTNWFGKKKKVSGLEDCSGFEVDKHQSDSFYGGFKEFKPPIYEHESALNVGFKTTDLLSDHIPYK